MRILVTNDDGYKSKGIRALVEMLRPFGEITVIAPKYHQSGTSMAVTMGLKPIAVRQLPDHDGVRWFYVDGTPASCVKFGTDEVFAGGFPDIVVSGINHGANCASAVLYSGTLGAAKEAALAGISAIGVSLDDMSPEADFSCMKEYFPELFKALLDQMDGRFGEYYNINFPALPASSIKGIRTANQGVIHWEKEFEPYDYQIFDRLGISHRDMGITALPELEEGERAYIMKGELVNDPRNGDDADHNLLKHGYITISAHNIDSTDRAENARLKARGIEKDF